MAKGKGVGAWAERWHKGDGAMGWGGVVWGFGSRGWGKGLGQGGALVKT